MLKGFSAVLLVALCSVRVVADTSASAIPPVVLQGYAEKVRPGSARLFSNGSTLTGGAVGARTVGFDVSFVNTTSKTANLVIVRIGETDFAKIGTFSPGVVIAWRLAASPGACSIHAVRFDDGSEWSAPEDASPLPSVTP